MSCKKQIGEIGSQKRKVLIDMKRIMSDSESIDFNIFIDKMGITNKDVYRTILDDFLESNLNIKTFIKYFNTNVYYARLLKTNEIALHDSVK